MLLAFEIKSSSTFGCREDTIVVVSSDNGGSVWWAIILTLTLQFEESHHVHHKKRFHVVSSSTISSDLPDTELRLITQSLFKIGKNFLVAKKTQLGRWLVFLIGALLPPWQSFGSKTPLNFIDLDVLDWAKSHYWHSKGSPGLSWPRKNSQRLGNLIQPQFQSS